MSTNIRTLRPVLRIGQRTNPTREFTLSESEGKTKPIDLTSAERVTLTMEHYTRAFTAVSDGEAADFPTGTLATWTGEDTWICVDGFTTIMREDGLFFSLAFLRNIYAVISR